MKVIETEIEWTHELIELIKCCLWDLIDTTKMSGNTISDAISALDERKEQIK